jgi:uncharacterized protein YicC (UPF0701 family)
MKDGVLEKMDKCYSMTGYASAVESLPLPGDASHQASHAEGGAVSVAVELRSVNSRFLDLQFRLADEVRGCETALREMLMAKLARGKVEVRVTVQRSGATGYGGALLNDATVRQLAELQHQVIKVFNAAELLRVDEILRWPGILASASLPLDALREATLVCGRQALEGLLDTRAREGAQLAQMLLAHVAEMEAIITRITPLVPDAIARYQQKMVERLQQALRAALPGYGVTAGTKTGAGSGDTVSNESSDMAERIRQEVALYGMRVDIAEELTRLRAHLAETRHLIEQGGPLGKRLDFMMQELNREANTLGAKAALKELADASMQLKLLIEQMREQIQNLE